MTNKKYVHAKYGIVTCDSSSYDIDTGEEIITVTAEDTGEKYDISKSELLDTNQFDVGDSFYVKEHGDVKIIGQSIDLSSNGTISYITEKADRSIVHITEKELENSKNDILDTLIFDEDGASYRVKSHEVDLETMSVVWKIQKETGEELFVSQDDIFEKYYRERTAKTENVVSEHVVKIENIEEFKSSIAETIAKSFEEFKEIASSTETFDDTKIVKSISKLAKIQKTLAKSEDFIEIYTEIQKFSDIMLELKDVLSVEKAEVNIMPIVNKLEKIQKLIESIKPFEFPRMLIEDNAVRVTFPKKMLTKEGRLKVDAGGTGGGGGGSIAIGGGGNKILDKSGQKVNPATSEDIAAVKDAIENSSGSLYGFVKKEISDEYKYYGFSANIGTKWLIKRKDMSTGEWKVAFGDGDYAENFDDRENKTYNYI